MQQAMGSAGGTIGNCPRSTTVTSQPREPGHGCGKPSKAGADDIACGFVIFYHFHLLSRLNILRVFI